MLKHHSKREWPAAPFSNRLKHVAKSPVWSVYVQPRAFDECGLFFTPKVYYLGPHDKLNLKLKTQRVNINFYEIISNKSKNSTGKKSMRLFLLLLLHRNKIQLGNPNPNPSSVTQPEIAIFLERESVCVRGRKSWNLTVVDPTHNEWLKTVTFSTAQSLKTQSSNSFPTNFARSWLTHYLNPSENPNSTKTHIPISTFLTQQPTHMPQLRHQQPAEPPT